ncbi:MAG TPA: HTTM domain-containing protein [Flavobacteriaceae bacterium]|nr:HTTM domain-containing protein [Flavobacteriaceae bacterium]
MLNRYLFKRIDNSALIVFRVLFGVLIIAQSWGSILTGYVRKRLIPTQFTFNFIGFDFIQPLPDTWMYVFFIAMGIFGVGVMIGYKYKLSISMFTLMWVYSYLMQKTSYNNHYYLLILLCVFMIIVPAHRYLSIDVRQNPSLKKISMPNWVPLIFILQMGIVYTYAAVAKIYPDWLDGTVATNLMKSKAHYPLIGFMLQETWVIWTIVYFGIFFDLLIVPLMLWKKTRRFAFVLAVFFHLFNSVIFQIGIFPYLALALFIFFFPPKTIHGLFLKGKKFYDKEQIYIPPYRNLLVSFLGIWFIIQLILPIRHRFIKGDVLWTEEGHRLSWRMMLRNRGGFSKFKIIDKQTGEETIVNKNEYLTPRQISATATKPDVIWQFAQRLKKEYAEKGQDISIYVEGYVGVNGHPSRQFINPEVDMAQAKWNYFGHNDWILLYEKK